MKQAQPESPGTLTLSLKYLAPLVFGLAALGWSDGAPKYVRLSPTVFRFQAVAAPLPEYPRGGTGDVDGIAVIEVLVAIDGSVSSVQVLEATRKEFGESVAKTVTQWRFRPLKTDSGEAVGIRGKLVFYFKLKDEKSVVIDAAEANGCGYFRTTHNYMEINELARCEQFRGMA